MDDAAYDVHPFVLLNDLGNIDSASTAAHEWGHAMHSDIVKNHQPFHYANYSLSLAEIASQVNELLLQDHLAKMATTKEEKIFLLSQVLDRTRSAFFRQVQFSEFELKMHEAVQNGEALSGEKLSSIYGKLLKDYYGHDRGVVTIDDEYAVEWASVPHFYYGYYVFNYATTLAAATYFVDQILSGKAGALDNYLAVLKSGGSQHPHEVLMAAGLDMTSSAPYQALMRRMNHQMDELERLAAPWHE
jgi:oligoendopeptidase F